MLILNIYDVAIANEKIINFVNDFQEVNFNYLNYYYHTKANQISLFKKAFFTLCKIILLVKLSKPYILESDNITTILFNISNARFLSRKIILFIHGFN